MTNWLNTWEAIFGILCFWTKRYLFRSRCNIKRLKRWVKTGWLPLSGLITCNQERIDAGTAITYELIDASGSYLGGNISPGMTTRFRALNLFTEKLPLVVEQEYIPLVGTDTETAIQAGVVNGIVCEMDGYIEMLRLNYPNLLVFLTGGHSFYFERRLKNSIFADINLVLTGLNRILEYNVED